jgi:hypothetical protein
MHAKLPDRVLHIIQMSQAGSADEVIEELGGNIPKQLILLGDLDQYL